jgi:hypothetical protein
MRFLNQGPSGPGPVDDEDAKPSCVPPGAFLDVILGHAGGHASARLLEHAAACDACGIHLAMTLRAFEDEPSAEEQADTAADWDSAPADDWHAELAQKLALTPTRRLRHPYRRLQHPRHGRRQRKRPSA